ncbi:tetratricopeptide repeat protein [Altererythrobacter sp. MF3-039]|uniref:tetratricopeptide repeat protein n=1 Tax=Altererythrobacter sp. MF3-039 TaxID=3252901 RepID=UPI00390CB093
MAQDNSEQRVRKLEAEVRALQRKVFPGGDGRFFEPEISSAQGQGTTVSTPSTTAVTDILSRLDAMESQIQRLTGQVEENDNSLRALTTRIAALEMAAGASATTAETNGEPATTPSEPAAATPAPAATVAEPEPSAPADLLPAGPTDERLAAVQAIAKPQTDDSGEDEYTYGFRLWNAGFYPEAQQQLALFLEQYPNHSRTTYGRNLLGRAYLDDGKPREAAPWFLKNYQADKQDRRAPDSLLYLAESMIALQDTDRACIALAEFGETYPALAAGRLQDQYEANRAKVSCN